MVGITWAADGVEEWKEKVQEGGLGQGDQWEEEMAATKWENVRGKRQRRCWRPPSRLDTVLSLLMKPSAKMCVTH